MSIVALVAILGLTSMSSFRGRNDVAALGAVGATEPSHWASMSLSSSHSLPSRRLWRAW